MAHVSQNGYSVIADWDDCKVYTIGDSGARISLRPDECGYLLAHLARRFHNNIEKLNPTDCHGYSKRQIAGSDDWSNHASGTAIDLNATQHSYGKVGTFSDSEEAKIRELLEDYDEVIKWGGDYRYTKDEMHFEIIRPYAEVKKIAAVHRRNNEVRLSRLVPGKRNLDVYMLKRVLAKSGLFDGEMNNYFGGGLQRAYAKWQESLGYTGTDADGIPGPYSLERLGFKVK